MSIKVKLVNAPSKEVPITAPRVVGPRLWEDFRREMRDALNGAWKRHGGLFQSEEDVVFKVISEGLEELEWMPIEVRKRLLATCCAYELKRSVINILWGKTAVKRILRKIKETSSNDLQQALRGVDHRISTEYHQWFQDNKGGKARLSDLVNDMLPKVEASFKRIMKDQYIEPDVNVAEVEPKTKA